jgi:hypothetical protein
MVKNSFEVPQYFGHFVHDKEQEKTTFLRLLLDLANPPSVSQQNHNGYLLQSLFVSLRCVLQVDVLPVSVGVKPIPKMSNFFLQCSRVQDRGCVHG